MRRKVGISPWFWPVLPVSANGCTLGKSWVWWGFRFCFVLTCRQEQIYLTWKVGEHHIAKQEFQTLKAHRAAGVALKAHKLLVWSAKELEWASGSRAAGMELHLPLRSLGFFSALVSFAHHHLADSHIGCLRLAQMLKCGGRGWGMGRYLPWAKCTPLLHPSTDLLLFSS